MNTIEIGNTVRINSNGSVGIVTRVWADGPLSVGTVEVELHNGSTVLLSLNDVSYFS